MTVILYIQYFDTNRDFTSITKSGVKYTLFM